MVTPEIPDFARPSTAPFGVLHRRFSPDVVVMRAFDANFEKLGRRLGRKAAMVRDYIP
jgi:hypothetical protein